jgi:serine/threonine-protein kinase HipA
MLPFLKNTSTGSYETLLKATHLYTDNLNEVKKMYKLIVFNCLIGNGDAHLKNFALQYTPDMQKVFVSPPFDITHTLIYDTIDNKMALKLAGSKVFPDKAELIKLAQCGDFKMRDAEQIIDHLAAGILDYLTKSNEIKLFIGLRQSIELSVAKVMSVSFSKGTYRHDKKRKFT